MKEKDNSRSQLASVQSLVSRGGVGHSVLTVSVVATILSVNKSTILRNKYSVSTNNIFMYSQKAINGYLIRAPRRLDTCCLRGSYKVQKAGRGTFSLGNFNLLFYSSRETMVFSNIVYSNSKLLRGFSWPIIFKLKKTKLSC
jgi:hypothetical protein